MKSMMRSSTVWTLTAGFVIGVASVASVFNGTSLGVRPAHAQPDLEVRAVSMPADALGGLRMMDQALADLAGFAAPAVVHVKAEGRRTTDVFGRSAPSGGEGSGFIFRSDGYIITNDHVVGGFEKVKVVLNDGREMEGKVIRADDTDMAVVKIEATGLPTLSFADSSKVRPGQIAMAIGSPFGFENSVTVGHVSALGRLNAIPDMRLGRDRDYFDLIQTDTPINMGNSGGPLINVSGEVIGINTSIFSPTGVSMGIGFAIPSNQARFIAETLIEKGRLARSFLGVEPDSLKEFQKREMDLPGGAILTKVLADGPAGKAGLKDGDVVVRIGTYPVNDQMDLRNATLRYEAGMKVPVEVVRDGDRKTFEVELAPRPTQTQEPPQPRLQEVTPFPDLREFRGMPNPRERDVPPLSGSPRLGIGIEAVTPALRKQFSIPAEIQGVVVMSVEPDTVAARSDLQIGDVIEEIDGTRIDGVDRLRETMRGLNWGDTKRLRVGRYRDGSKLVRTFDVVFR
jgi:serine protease Do